MLTVVFLWVVFGFAAAAVASSRGGSALAGFLWGFLLGPIGLIVVCFVALPTPVHVAAVDGAAERTCPHCYSTIPTMATVCRYCQRESEPQETAPKLDPCAYGANGHHRWAIDAQDKTREVCIMIPCTASRERDYT